MSTWMLLLLLSPIMLLIGVFGAVVIVALRRARPEDIPAVMQACVSVFRRLAERLPTGANSVDGVDDSKAELDSSGGGEGRA